ncbi:VCBS repeat-containing protein, partial [Patescibacteria group bacterium]|nr:VCBS repeat-containing protein [Patescibacteria group bacterium]
MKKFRILFSWVLVTLFLISPWSVLADTSNTWDFDVANEYTTSTGAAVLDGLAKNIRVFFDGSISGDYTSGESNDIDVEAADLDGDDDIDLYVVNGVYSGSVLVCFDFGGNCHDRNHLWLNNGDGTFTAADFDAQGTAHDAEIADLNGDTYPDIYVA